MSLLIDNVMNEQEGFLLEAADQCGLFNTDDDCEHMRGPIKAIILFARVMQRSGMWLAKTAHVVEGTRDAAGIDMMIDALDAITGPLIEQHRIEWLAAYNTLPPAKAPYSGKHTGTQPDHIIDDVLTIAHGYGSDVAIAALASYRAGTE